MRGSSRGCEALLSRLQHHVAHFRAGDAHVGYRRLGDDLPVESVDGEGERDDLFVPASELQIVGAPAQVRPHHHHLAVMEAALGNGHMRFQQHGVGCP